MGICYIVGAGDCENLVIKNNREDLIVAADGGYKHLLSAGITPDIIIGDFDSLGEIPEGENIIKLNPVKDITDLHAATDVGIEKGYNEFVVFGALGGRFDHSLANIQLLARLSQVGCKAVIRDGKTFVTAITDGAMSFDPSFRGYVSVFSHTDKCEKVTVKGMKYCLENAELSNSFSLGVSNEFIGINSEIIIGKGTAIVIYSE